MVFAVSVDAVLLFGLDNEANQAAPQDFDLPWSANARIADEGGGSPQGSAVHLGFGYMLTANHVSLRSHVSFDGSTWYARDTSFTPVQVADDVDLKVFRLTQTPSVSAATLHDGGGELDTLGYHVGWGRGRASDDDIGEDVQSFGNDSTIAKRWGTNVVRDVGQESWTIGSTTYSQQALVTVLGNQEGDNEAALALYDSGSGYYQEINGNIVLTGIGGAIERQNSPDATFGDEALPPGSPNRGDRNFMVQIGPYKDDIVAIIPEPGHYGMIVGLLFVPVLFYYRRRKSCG